MTQIVLNIEDKSLLPGLRKILGSLNGVKHNADISAGGIFHTYGNVKAACHKPVLLIFNRSRANSNVC